jgi:hypothetical protein
MHPHLADLFVLLEQSQAALRDAVASVPAAARTQRPAPDRWSVAEILEHLALVDARFARAVEEAIAAARLRGLGPETGAREPLEEGLRRRIADRSEKRQAPEVAVPSGRLDAEAAWHAMTQAHHGFRAVVEAADGLALSGVSASHPRWGPLTVYQYTELLAGHEQRHAAQIREMAGAAA